ncbi:MAG: endopeptidase La [Desulfobulbaceae bacterium]|uniref:Lon protease n=1 Tax=Candidatus Desulfobia pelagia TaxID=2841692 RepID=A0A8J6TFL2_9BACT|nr:endopeptidase La [Candidatus Desulfobia pelagia]
MSEDKSEEKQETKKSSSDLEKIIVPAELPILPLHGFVFFPGMGFPLQIKSDSAKKLIDDILLGDRLLGLFTHKPAASEEEQNTPPEGAIEEHLYSIGVMGYIHKLIKGPENTYHVLTSGLKKVHITTYTQSEPYLKAEVEELELIEETGKEIEAFDLNLRTQFKKLAELTMLPAEVSLTAESIISPSFTAYLIASMLHLPIEEEQAILEIANLKGLLHRVTADLNKRLETAKMSQKIQKSAKDDIDKKQREFFLREQMNAIKKELGEDKDNVEIVELRAKLAKAKLSTEAKEVAEKELNRLERIPPSSPEYTVSRNYLDWLLDLPWEFSTEDNIDINKAKEDLDKDHYGLERIKKRIIEFLAVRKLKQDMHGPILCFAGPPGTGKTSLGQSIARTMGRKFVRLSLGGVRDEAEIRGHRRTYIGALPGRIIQSLRKAGSNNPLFMLDEIDKLGTDFRGDPSSALLEVLDPEQNSTFSDHYMEVPFDLSKVMFITTANMLDTIPPPLRDRMETITLSGYTDDEKLHIAKRHLLEKELDAHGLTADDLTFTDDSIRAIIRSYTREAGVRNIERKLAGVCRGAASKIAAGEPGPFNINVEDLEDFLGPVEFFPETMAHSWGPGLATGLAWTPVGGELLFIESAQMKGKGELKLTGKLGDVMKESASAALTYIQAHSQELGIDEDLFAKKDIHIHVPEGATPKDGPSAGVAMVVSLTSLLTGRPVRKDVAMTGEITLRGDVLPVGGVKDKVLAAVRSGITDIILPALNKKDISELRENVRETITFHYTTDIKEALKVAIP